MNKSFVKNEIIARFSENAWTNAQARLYSDYMKFAVPFKDSIRVITDWQKIGSEIFIISHKTKFALSGENINLIKYAENWVREHFKNTQIGCFTNPSNIYFEGSIKSKIDRILSTGCEIFIDDLKNVLDDIPGNILKIHFKPESEDSKDSFKNWIEIEEFIKRSYE